MEAALWMYQSASCRLVVVCVCVSMSRQIGEEVAVWYVLSSGIYYSDHRGEERAEHVISM
jgi:hypothetical protein